MSKQLRTRIKELKLQYYVTQPERLPHSLVCDEGSGNQTQDCLIQRGLLDNSVIGITELSPELQLTDRSNISKTHEGPLLRRTNTFNVKKLPKDSLVKLPLVSSEIKNNIKHTSLEPVQPDDLCLFYRYKKVALVQKRNVH